MPTDNYTTITACVNHGTIIAVHLAQGSPVYFDHRPFGWMVDARGADNIIGARVRRAYSPEGGESLVFEDEEEWS